MNIFKVGDFVIYNKPDNGRESDREINQRLLTIGNSYKIRYIKIGTYFDSLMFENINGMFNSDNFSFDDNKNIS